MTAGLERDYGGPLPVSNPPGQSQIAYRAGDFAAFRRALLSPLAGEQQLANWSPSTGDLGLQALEWWAYLADILTFYNERIANGSYLGTAVAQPGPQNAAGLAALLGYLTTPGVTATGVVAAIRSASAAVGPLVIPAGMQIASTPAAGVPAQLFEVTRGATFTGPSDAVIGIPSDKWGETPIALVVLAAGASATEDDLRAWCRDRLAHYKCPSEIRFVEELARTATGKLQKFKLRAPFWEGRERQVN